MCMWGVGFGNLDRCHQILDDVVVKLLQSLSEHIIETLYHVIRVHVNNLTINYKSRK